MNYTIPMSIPRKIGADLQMQQAWAIVRAHGKSRKKMAAYIAAFGGQSYQRCRYAVAHCIKVGKLDFSAEHLYTKCPVSMLDGKQYSVEEQTQIQLLYGRIISEYENSLYEEAIRWSFESFENDFFFLFGEDRPEMEYTQEGRSGGWLCFSSIAGINTDCDEDELEKALLEREDAGDGRYGAYEIPDEKVCKLFLWLVHMTVAMTPADICSDVEFEAASIVEGYAEGQLDDTLKNYHLRGGLDVQSVYDSLSDDSHRDTFSRVCELAGVNVKEH